MRLGPGRDRPRAFTLVELLVVIAIIAMLAAILLPSLTLARKQARAAVCMTRLRGLGMATAMYWGENKDYVVPSYTMNGTTALDMELEGWGPIFEKFGYLNVADAQFHNSPFVCPETVDVAGVATGQTGTDPDNPKGWMDWPCRRTSTGYEGITIPDRGFDKIIRVAYWINADNPVDRNGSPIRQDIYYSGSVGYGPGSDGRTMGYTKTSSFVRPYTLIAFADGLYAGRHTGTRIGDANERIGYRHPGGKGTANAVFSDGHVQSLEGTTFPRATYDPSFFATVLAENDNGQPTVYCNPERWLRNW